MAHLYPAFLNLSDKGCLVVGGGKVAERKTATLIEYGARVRLVSPQVTPMIDSWATQGIIAWRQGLFHPDDLNDVQFVFAATGDSQVNKSIYALSRQRGILVNSAVDPPHCDFYVPAILRRGSLCIAISTEGKSPLLAAKLRKELERVIPDEYEEWVEILGSLRETIKKSDLDISERQKLFKQLVYSDIFDLLKEGGKEEVEERIAQCMSCLRE